MQTKLVLFGTALLFLQLTCQSEEWALVSPNGEVKLTVNLSSAGKGEGNQLSYQVEHGTPDKRAMIVQSSPLGLRLRGQDLVDLRFDSAQPQRSIEEAYILSHGKRRECRNWANTRSLTFRNSSGRSLVLDLRAYNNGVAFRYRLPGSASDRQTVEAEATGFALPLDARIWCAPSDKATTYSPAYETYYEDEMAVGTASPTGVGWAFPLLFRTADSRHWALITEANVDGNCCGSRLSSTASNGVYSIAFPDPAEGNGQGAVQPSSTLPWEMPWRVIVVGNTPGAMVESTLVTDVSASSRVLDRSWIRPGRVAWSWWSDNPSPKDGAKQKKFVDLAAEMGWEYVLVDANWTVMDNGNIHDVLRYGKEKGVGVLLWYNSGGPQNVVTEKPRDCLTYAPVRQFELNMLHEWGVKGIKVDFFQSDKQDVMGLYQGIMEDAAAQKIMVNFHGCTLPRGWERTYPHLMSMEAVRGEECYIFDPQYPERAPGQNTITPFTRNAVGPMDYTPVGFSDNRYPHRTTWAHELALTVLFETGWLHFTDKPESYLGLPPAPKQFLKDVPVVWDETRFIDGYPGQFVILARRKNDAWYIAGVNGENRAREMSVKPGDWLANGRYDLSLIGDGENAHSFQSSARTFEAREGFPVKLLPHGGFAAVVKPAK